MWREIRKIKTRGKQVYMRKLQREGKINAHINANGYTCYDPEELRNYQKTHKRGRPPKIKGE